MADNLPLIPGKETTVCADVTPVLREVFREMDQLPLITGKTSATDDEKQWLEKYNAECEKTRQHEGDLKTKFAKRISKKSSRNLYKLFEPTARQDDQGDIRRMDLMPGIEQSATGNKSLWVQNILNRSSCEFSYEKPPVNTKLHQPLKSIGLDEHSRQSYSVGQLSVLKSPLLPVELEPIVPEYVYCVPEQIHFVNFTLGHTHTQHIRLVNVSKFEIRLSVSLPQRSELSVELHGSRGLRVTAGSASELKIHFRPIDVRTFHDKLRIRTSLGKGLVVPIVCYMVPPELHIIVHKVDPSPSRDENSVKIAKSQEDLVDLGAKLLGDEHYAPIIMHCEETHASFFMVTEDAWVNWSIEELTPEGSVKTGPFTIKPAWWAGGGVIRGAIHCRAVDTGLHTADVRIVSSTAITRTLTVIADSVYYDPDHITVQAQEKNYEVDSEDDPDCEYYVHLGTAFPNRSLSATVQVINHSPIPYSFYWNYRAWGVCSCWQKHVNSASSLEIRDINSNISLCHGAQLAKDLDLLASLSDESVRNLRAEPQKDIVRERTANDIRVFVPDVGQGLGTHRAVMQLILKDVPVESFRPSYIPNTVCERIVKETGSDGKVWSRKVCDIVQAQMEVWWDVVPPRFVIDVPVLPMFHSRRVKSIQVSFCVTQLYGCDNIKTLWHSSVPMVLPISSNLSPSCSVGAKVVVPLPSLPNECPETNTITLKAETNEWSARCHVTRACVTRHPALTPARHWLRVVVPGAKVSADIDVCNNTHQEICWWATPYRWVGENPPSAQCNDDARSCAVCHERACTCLLIQPSRGALAHGERATIHYNVHAPTTDRIVATLVKVARTAPDVAKIPGAPACNARATLLAYRVLAPRLVLEVFPCGGDKLGGCERCALDSNKTPGSAILRPSRALTSCVCSCYKLRITNTTPIPTTVQWEKPVEGEDFLRVKFSPNDFDIGRYATKEITAILEPRRMCGRRLFVLRAQVAHAYKHLYLVIDTAIDGVRIVFEVPLGGAGSDSFVTLRGIQKEVHPWDNKNKPTTPEEWFKEDDRKRAVVQENRCDCHFQLEYIPPKKPLRPPSSVPSSPEILTSPPSLTRVCKCFNETKPMVPQHEEPPCLQYRNLPIRTVGTRRLILRNDGKVTAQWRMVVRRWSRHRNHAAAVEALIVGKDRWAGDVRHPGVIIQCSPAAGICVAGQTTDILVQVYADCFGLYYDQIMLMVDHVEAIIVDVWIEAVGPVLQFANPSCQPEFDSTMWLSQSDAKRTLRVKNTSRSTLTIHAFTALEHEHAQDTRPFRLYLRFTDEIRPVCPCSTYASSNSFGVSHEATTLPTEMDTGIELYLGDDYGIQDEDYYWIEPRECSVPPGEWMEWQVALNPTAGDEIAPLGLVVLRTVPEDDRGAHWHRWEPTPARVGVRTAPRAPALRLSCKEVRAHLCALELHYNEVARIRKRFHVRNIGNAPLKVLCGSEAPWQVVMNKAHSECGHCGCKHEQGDRYSEVELILVPWSSTEICVEIELNTTEMWPEVKEVQDVEKKCLLSSYPPKWEVTGQVTFYCDKGLLETLPLTLEVDYPILSLEPECIDFGYVTHGDTRKTYFSVWHSSLSATITLGVTWEGSASLRLYPRHFRLAPRQRARVYVQYTAAWTGAPVPVEGCVLVTAAAGAGAWCRGALYARARPALDARFRRGPSDHTDETNLWPPNLPQL